MQLGRDWVVKLVKLGFTLIIGAIVFSKGITMPNTMAPASATADNMLLVTKLAMDVMALPFDVARAQYARAVQLGLVERSMLASRDFARTLRAVERLTLGPWARHV